VPTPVTVTRGVIGEGREAVRAVVRFASACGVVGLCAIVGATAWAQAPPGRIDLATDEREIIASLASAGVGTAVGRAVVHLPRGAMSADDERALATRLNQSIDELDAFTHSPRAWQRNPARIDYYFPPSLFVSYAKPVFAQVFVALPRLESGEAPLLHETAHVLLSPSADFIATHADRSGAENDERAWLIEGIATYVAMSVSRAASIPEGDPLGVGPIDQLDVRCAAALATPVADEVLPFIGSTGAPDALESVTRRADVAPAFYRCSASFNKYLAARFGLDALIGLVIAEHTAAPLETLAGQNVDALRAAWRREIGAGR
jgi:hypothetical protein